MHNDFKSPPKSRSELTPFSEILKRLKPLVGTKFNFVPAKAKTNGSNLRKLLAAKLHESDLPEAAPIGSFKLVPIKAKGIPKLKREFIDTYVISTGEKYNLQVWNRIPNSESILIEFDHDDHLRSKDVRFILVKINVSKNIIESIIGMTADYIEENFGKFGKETVKHQLIISPKMRQKVIAEKDSILFHDDDKKIKFANTPNLSSCSILDKPDSATLIPLSKIKKLITPLIGMTILEGSTRKRAQMLEILIAETLGYPIKKSDTLAGGYPDIPHQALEIKIQDSPTVDFGEYTPEYDIDVPNCHNFKTSEIRYLIALMNPKTSKIEGIVLCPGGKLGKYFTHIAEKSYKCQRNIPMTFFEDLKGKCVLNPVVKKK